MSDGTVFLVVYYLVVCACAGTINHHKHPVLWVTFGLLWVFLTIMAAFALVMYSFMSLCSLIASML